MASSFFHLSIFHNGTEVLSKYLSTGTEIRAALDSKLPPQARGSVALLTQGPVRVYWHSAHSMAGPRWQMAL